MFDEWLLEIGADQFLEFKTCEKYVYKKLHTQAKLQRQGNDNK